VKWKKASQEALWITRIDTNIPRSEASKMELVAARMPSIGERFFSHHNPKTLVSLATSPSQLSRFPSVRFRAGSRARNRGLQEKQPLIEVRERQFDFSSGDYYYSSHVDENGEEYEDVDEDGEEYEEVDEDEEQYEDEEEEELSFSSASAFLSLNVKPDRNLALLDDYEMEENDFDPNSNHRSG